MKTKHRRAVTPAAGKIICVLFCFKAEQKQKAAPGGTANISVFEEERLTVHHPECDSALDFFNLS
ncbi:MAG: hypothetical protein A2Y58_05680 [Chloroflexi bacterium RBG_13_51_52]|nr:MAG: hypothetical protein A2Y58_05680 [Chloroflexi bacterium RBG_13_51_52]